MAMKKTPFYVYNKTTLASATQRIELLTVEPGFLYCVQLVSCRNNNTASSKVALQVNAGGIDMPVGYLSLTTTAWPGQFPNTIYVTEKQTIVVLMITATTGDTVEFYVSGWKSRVGEMALQDS